jgi:hypothetical protein
MLQPGKKLWHKAAVKQNINLDTNTKKLDVSLFIRFQSQIIFL